MAVSWAARSAHAALLSTSAGRSASTLITAGTGPGTESVTASTEGNGDPPFTLANLQQFDGGAGNPADAWFFSIPGDLAFFPSDASAQIELRTDGVSDALLPGSNGLTGSVLIPDQARFENATGSFQRRSNGSIDAGVTFELDTLTLPEPASGSAVAVGAVAWLARARSRSGRKRSLAS